MNGCIRKQQQKNQIKIQVSILRNQKKKSKLYPQERKQWGKKKNKERKQKNNGEKSMKLKAGKYQQN